MNKRDKYLELASKRYHHQFLNEENADHSAVSAGKKYLADHGILSQAIAKRWMFGVVINPLPEDERFRGWFSIPYLTLQGCKAIRFRNITDRGGHKYGQAKGQPVRIYNSAACFEANEVIGISEGEIDAVAATVGLGLPTVGLPGARQWIAKERIWKPIFKNYQRVLILRDGDSDGRALADAIVDTLGLKARIINMPEGEDVSSMLVQGRASELTKQFNEAGDD